MEVSEPATVNVIDWLALSDRSNRVNLVIGKLFLFGGYSNNGCSRALSIYDPEEQTWFRVSQSRSVDEAEIREDYTVLGRMNRTSSHTAVATPMGILILGGLNRKFKLARMLTSGSRRPSQCARKPEP